MTTHESQKGYKGFGMEGPIATWYAALAAADIDDYRRCARLVAGQVAANGHILELASGPGYLAIELAKIGTYQVVGLDISKSFVKIGARKAEQASVSVTFRQGNAADMPFDGNSFDFVVCRAAFKNFAEPVKALNEIYRVLKPAGRALIIDLRKDYGDKEIAAHVRDKGTLNALIMKAIFKFLLKRRAYTKEAIERMAGQSTFGGCDIRLDSIGFELWLQKSA
jgi:ubiquinone/menaquinone biosynthesis C-methylase UbiE